MNEKENILQSKETEDEQAIEPAPEQTAQPGKPTEAQQDQAELRADDLQPQVTLRSVVEAILFASDEPLEASKIAKVAGAGDARQVRKLVSELNDQYSQRVSAYHIEQIAGGYVMLTLPEYNDWLKQLLQTRHEHKLSQAALETLAIVAYKQPVMRVTVEAIRGVGAGEMIRNLMEKGLVRIVGRAEELGRPLLYGTTRKFLEVFGLNSLQDLPQVEELRPQGQSPSEPPQPSASQQAEQEQTDQAEDSTNQPEQAQQEENTP